MYVYQTSKHHTHKSRNLWSDITLELNQVAPDLTSNRIPNTTEFNTVEKIKGDCIGVFCIGFVNGETYCQFDGEA